MGTSPWTVGVLLTHQTVLRPAGTNSSSHARVPSSLSLRRLVTAASVASQVAVDSTPAPPPSPPPVEAEEGGPIELPDYEDPLAIPSSGVTPLQSAASILLTGTIGVLLYRSLRRRMKQAKETKVRSTGLENINEASKKAPVLADKAETTAVKAPLSAWQTFQGAVIAGAIAYVLYKFSSYVDAGFAAKPVSNVYTVRQLTITIRTIVTGLCYLATFVFAANSLGLTLYSLQLLFNLGPTETTQKGGDERVKADEDPLDTGSLEEVKKE